jgi:hypothetical protein
MSGHEKINRTPPSAKLENHIVQPGEQREKDYCGTHTQEPDTHEHPQSNELCSTMIRPSWRRGGGGKIIALKKLERASCATGWLGLDSGVG